MRRAGGLLVLASLLVAACGPILDRDEAAEKVSEETVDRVVADVIRHLDAAHAEAGPLFVDRLPAIQKAAANAQGFEDWTAFLASVRATDADEDLAIASRITEHMRKLLAEKPPESEEKSE